MIKLLTTSYPPEQSVGHQIQMGFHLQTRRRQIVGQKVNWTTHVTQITFSHRIHYGRRRIDNTRTLSSIQSRPSRQNGTQKLDISVLCLSSCRPGIASPFACSSPFSPLCGTEWGREKKKFRRNRTATANDERIVEKVKKNTSLGWFRQQLALPPVDRFVKKKEKLQSGDVIGLVDWPGYF